MFEMSLVLIIIKNNNYKFVFGKAATVAGGRPAGILIRFQHQEKVVNPEKRKRGLYFLKLAENE